jgi:hypothetical protein
MDLQNKVPETDCALTNVSECSLLSKQLKQHIEIVGKFA